MKMPHRQRRLFLRSLLRDPRGVSVVEFAIAAPVLAVFVLGISDLSRAISTHFTVKQAVNRGLEVVQAGPALSEANAVGIDYSDVVQEAAAAADVPEDQVELSLWRECGHEEAADFGGSCPAGTETARYLKLRVTKHFASSFPINGIDLSAAAAVRLQ